jgi:Galactose oxidase, central domain
MPFSRFFSRNELTFTSSTPPPANGLASQSTQQPQPVCTWSAHAPHSGPSPSPFPRSRHTLTATAIAAGESFLFGGYVPGRASSDLYVLSTRDFSTTLLQTSGEVPSPRFAHGAALIGTTLLVCGGKTNIGDRNVPNHDSLYLLNLGTSDLLMSSPTPADHNFALQYRESGPVLSSMVLGPMVVPTIPQPWSVPSSSSLVVRSAGIFSMICGHLI